MIKGSIPKPDNDDIIISTPILTNAYFIDLHL